MKFFYKSQVTSSVHVFDIMRIIIFVLVFSNAENHQFETDLYSIQNVGKRLLNKELSFSNSFQVSNWTGV